MNIIISFIFLILIKNALGGRIYNLGLITKYSNENLIKSYFIKFKLENTLDKKGLLTIIMPYRIHNYDQNEVKVILKEIDSNCNTQENIFEGFSLTKNKMIMMISGEYSININKDLQKNKLYEIELIASNTQVKKGVKSRISILTGLNLILLDENINFGSFYVEGPPDNTLAVSFTVLNEFTPIGKQYKSIITIQPSKSSINNAIFDIFFENQKENFLFVENCKRAEGTLIDITCIVLNQGKLIRVIYPESLAPFTIIKIETNIRNPTYVAGSKLTAYLINKNNYVVIESGTSFEKITSDFYPFILSGNIILMLGTSKINPNSKNKYLYSYNREKHKLVNYNGIKHCFTVNLFSIPLALKIKIVLKMNNVQNILSGSIHHNLPNLSENKKVICIVKSLDKNNKGILYLR